MKDPRNEVAPFARRISYSEVLQRIQDGGWLELQSLIDFGVTQIAAVSAQFRIVRVAAAFVAVSLLVDRTDLQGSLPVVLERGVQPGAGVEYSITAFVPKQTAEDDRSFGGLDVQFVAAVVGSVKVEERTSYLLHPVDVRKEALQLILVAVVDCEVDEQT